MAQGLQPFHREQGAALNTTECNDPAEHGRKAPNKLRDPVLLFQRDRKRTRGTDHLARIDTMTHLQENGFQATFELMTAESCEQGDAADRGWLDWRGDKVDDACHSHWDLQDLLELKGHRFEGDGSSVPSWITCDADLSLVIDCSQPWRFLACLLYTSDAADE